jgi:hypothetical protein
MKRLVLLLVLFAHVSFAQETHPFPGPRPYYDVTASPYGATGSGQSTTGNINSASKTLRLAAAKDFSNGNGIAVYGGGANPSIPSPTGLSASQVVTLPLIAPANDNIAGATCTGTTATISTRGWHGLTAGQNITVVGTRFSQYNITANIGTVPNKYQFTYPIANCPGPTGGGTIKLNSGSSTFIYEVVAIDAFNGVTAVSAPITVTHANAPLSNTIANTLTWTKVANATLYAVYGRIGGSLTCLGPAAQPQAPRLNPSWTDYGGGSVCPKNVPSAPPSAVVPQILITSISSGGGTTTLILNNAASSTVSGVTVEHDDTAAINAAIAAAASENLLPYGGGGIINIPLGHYNFQTLVFPVTTPIGSASMVIQHAGELSPRQPIFFNNIYQYSLIGSVGASSTSGQQKPAASILTNGLSPVVDIVNASVISIENENLIYCGNDCIRIESNSSGAGAVTNLNNINAGVINTGNGVPLHCITTGGGPYGIYLRNGVYHGALPQPSMLFENCGILSFDHVSFNGVGIKFTTNIDQVAGQIKWLGGISEGVVGPQFIFDTSQGGGTGKIAGVEISHFEPADPACGGDDVLVQSVGYGLEHLHTIGARDYGTSCGFPANRILEGVVTDFNLDCVSATTDCSGQSWPLALMTPGSSGIFDDLRGAKWMFSDLGTNPALTIVCNASSSTFNELAIDSSTFAYLGGFNCDGSASATKLGIGTTNPLFTADIRGSIGGATYNTETNCSSNTSPAACGSAAAGSVIVAASTVTEVVNTTAITANSQVLLTFDSSLGTKLGVTCNTTAVQGTVSARTAGTSFTIKLPTAPSTNPACFSYEILN